MEDTGACCVGMICTGSGGASPELVPSGTTLCACVRRIGRKCCAERIKRMDKSKRVKIKAGNLCIPGFVFTLSPRAQAKADRQRAVDAVHIFRRKVSHALAQTAFVQRADLLEQDD